VWVVVTGARNFDAKSYPLFSAFITSGPSFLMIW
jgi:hypothetical protein